MTARKPNHGKQFTFTVSMPPRLYAEYEHLAARLGVSRSVLARDALTSYLDNGGGKLFSLTSTGGNIELMRLKAREQELLEANNRYLQEAREARASLNAALALIEEMFE